MYECSVSLQYNYNTVGSDATNLGKETTTSIKRWGISKNSIYPKSQLLLRTFPTSMQPWCNRVQILIKLFMYWICFQFLQNSFLLHDRVWLLSHVCDVASKRSTPAYPMIWRMCLTSRPNCELLIITPQLQLPSTLKDMLEPWACPEWLPINKHDYGPLVTKLTICENLIVFYLLFFKSFVITLHRVCCFTAKFGTLSLMYREVERPECREACCLWSSFMPCT